MSALELSPSPEADQIIPGLRAIAVLALAAIPHMREGLEGTV